MLLPTDRTLAAAIFIGLFLANKSVRRSSDANGFSTEGKIETGLRKLECSGRNFVEIAKTLNVQVGHGPFSEALNGKTRFNDTTGENLIELLDDMKAVREQFKDVPIAWGATERIATLVVLARVNRITAEKVQLIEEIAEDWSNDEHARSFKKTLLEKPHVTLDSLRQQVNAIRERNRLYALTPAQIRAENAAKRAQASPENPPLHVARELASQEYPTMPETVWHEGKEIPLDSKFMRLCSGEQLRTLIKKYGDVQIVARVRQNRAPQVFGE
jgi:hypothetical protein